MVHIGNSVLKKNSFLIWASFRCDNNDDGCDGDDDGDDTEKNIYVWNLKCNTNKRNWK
jgi:hypothetical protein